MRPKQVYILPNLLTSINILCGMYCIVFSSSGEIEQMWYAAAILFAGMVADVFDGIIARLQRATSEFGIQYDSLADMISFGVAPAVLAYHLALRELPGRGTGVAIAFLYAVCAALRLARYNTQATTGEKKSFAGLPSPVAAGLIASCSAVMLQYGKDVPALMDKLTWPFAIMVGIVALLMISTVRYPSSKDLIVVGKKPFVYLTTATLAIAGTVINIAISTVIGFLIYVMFGVIRSTYRFFYPVPELGTEGPRKRRRIFKRRRPGRLLGRFRKNKARRSDERDSRG